MALRSTNKVNPNFNMSSLTDIIFLLLIFFMLTSTFVTPNALNLLLPSSNSQVTVEKKRIAVSITDDLSYYLGSTPIQAEELPILLTEAIAKEEQPTIVLNAERGVPIEKVVEIMNLANKLKVQMILATQPLKE